MSRQKIELFNQTTAATSNIKLIGQAYRMYVYGDLGGGTVSIEPELPIDDAGNTQNFPVSNLTFSKSIIEDFVPERDLNYRINVVGCTDAHVRLVQIA